MRNSISFTDPGPNYVALEGKIEDRFHIQKGAPQSIRQYFLDAAAILDIASAETYQPHQLMSMSLNNIGLRTVIGFMIYLMDNGYHGQFNRPSKTVDEVISLFLEETDYANK